MVYWRGGIEIVRDIQSASSRRDVFYLVTLMGITLAVNITGWWFTLQAAQSHALAGVGAALVLLGIAGTFYCRRHLGKFWTAENALQSNHQVVETGPYAVVRHPIYTAAILLYLGTGIVFPVWWNVLLVCLAALIYVLKTAHEDRFLAAHLPGYASYQQRVPYRLVLKVW